MVGLGFEDVGRGAFREGRPEMPDDRYPGMGYWARVTLTVVAVLALLAAAWSVRNILLLVLVATVLAVGLDPQVRWLQRRACPERGPSRSSACWASGSWRSSRGW